MVKHLTLFMLLAFCLTGCGGQQDGRSFTYQLRNPQNNGQFSTLHTMPDGALLMVSKRDEQPRQIWNLLRIADWDDSQPREDKLDVDVGPNDELVGWGAGTFQQDRYDRNDQLLMDPGGNYLVVRLSPDADLWKYHTDESARLPRTVLNIIDLHGFKLLRRLATTDPLLGAGDMGFTPKGALLVSGLQAMSSATTGGKVTYTRQYAVETLTLPGLEPEMVCSYSFVVSPYSAQTPATPEEFKRMQEENQEETDRQQNQKQAAAKACGPKLVPLGLTSLDDVEKDFTHLGRLEHDADYTQRVPMESPLGCDFHDMSQDRQYDLFDCDDSRGEGLFLHRYRGFKIFRLDDGTEIMDLKLPHNLILPESAVTHTSWFSGVLATRRGVTYSVLLRDGAELEGYRLP